MVNTVATRPDDQQTRAATPVDRQLSAPSVVMLTTDRQIDRRILLEADSLEAAGWTVVILAMAFDGDPVNDDRRVIRIGAPTGTGPGAATPASGQGLLKSYRRIRRLLPRTAFVRRAKIWAWQYLFDYEQFYRGLFLPAALQYRPTVFLAHNLPMLPVAVAAADASGARVAYDSHELFAEQDFAASVSRRWKELETRYIGRADLVTTVNRSIADEMAKRYGLDQVHVILNAEIPMRKSSTSRALRERLGLQDADRILLFQGGLSNGRNLATIVDAMARVADPSIHLVFLGDGELRSALEARTRKKSLSERVHFLAAVPQKELLGYTQSADVGLIPYQSNCLNNHLCTPNKLFEFIAAGTPILASDLPELRRFVAGYDIGMVADLANQENAAKAIAAAFSDAAGLAAWKQKVVAAQSEINWLVEGSKFQALFEPLR